MQRVAVALLLLCSLVVFPVVAEAYSGSLSGDQLAPEKLPPVTGTIDNPWYNNVEIRWDVTQTNGSWYYQYWFDTNLNGESALSHIILETSPWFNINSQLDYNGGSGYTAVYDDDWQNNTAGNPHIPNVSFGGIKVDISENNADGTTFYWSFYSIRNPVWGDFYAKDGATGGRDGETIAIWNAGFELEDPTSGPADGTINNKILRPDTENVRTPELSTWMLLGLSGLAGAFVVRRRKS